ncbi:hypothetical protein GGF32_001498, partial [Allomyces javanicus]
HAAGKLRTFFDTVRAHQAHAGKPLPPPAHSNVFGPSATTAVPALPSIHAQYEQLTGKKPYTPRTLREGAAAAAAAATSEAPVAGGAARTGRTPATARTPAAARTPATAGRLRGSLVDAVNARSTATSAPAPWPAGMSPPTKSAAARASGRRVTAPAASAAARGSGAIAPRTDYSATSPPMQLSRSVLAKIQARSPPTASMANLAISMSGGAPDPWRGPEASSTARSPPAQRRQTHPNQDTPLPAALSPPARPRDPPANQYTPSPAAARARPAPKAPRSPPTAQVAADPQPVRPPPKQRNGRPPSPPSAPAAAPAPAPPGRQKPGARPEPAAAPPPAVADSSPPEPAPAPPPTKPKRAANDPPPRAAPDPAPTHSATAPPSNFTACPHCSRTFAPDRIAKHATICQKSQESAARRGTFTMAAVRERGIQELNGTPPTTRIH